jgi:hypothetical protein
MKHARKPSVGKLLRVVVAGGMALAGSAGPLAAAAEDKPDPTGKAATEKAGASGAPADAAKKKEGTEKEKKKEPETKKAEEAGGVKGW